MERRCAATESVDQNGKFGRQPATLIATANILLVTDWSRISHNRAISHNISRIGRGANMPPDLHVLTQVGTR
jgi:hypothetical protein